MNQMPKKADLYFFVDVSEDYSVSMPKDLDGVKVFWAMDSAMQGGFERSFNIARQVDYIFTTNAEAYGPEAFSKFGIEATWVPYGYDEQLQQEVHQEKILNGGEDLDVFMCGNPNSPERVELWRLLNQNFKAVTGIIDTREEYVRAKARCKIVVNQPTAGHNNIINLRVWNATACGKLLLCKRTSISEMELLGFKDGENVIYWDEFSDLIEKIKYYLEHDEERRRIARNGSILGNKHLMVNQIMIIEQVIKSKFYKQLI
jgi:hypothetical protein